MNIDVIGRIRPNLRGEKTGSNLTIEGGKRISGRPGGSYCNFQYLFREAATNQDVFKQSVNPLLDLFLAGFNTSLICYGQSGAGKSFTLMGETMNKTGIVHMLFDQLFARIGSEETYMFDSLVAPVRPSLSITALEIYNETVRDLLEVPSGAPTPLLLAESAEAGVFARDATVQTVVSATEANTIFRQAWSRRTDFQTDYGPAQNLAHIILQLELVMYQKDSALPNRSRFTVVELAGAERLAEDPELLRQREGLTLHRSLLAFAFVVSALSSNPNPTRVINYSDSVLTKLLQDELGGNCRSRVLVCLKPQNDLHVLNGVLRTAFHVSQAVNYPVLNDGLLQGLITQYRARIMSLQDSLGLNLVAPVNTDGFGGRSHTTRAAAASTRATRPDASRPNPSPAPRTLAAPVAATGAHDLQAELLRLQNENLQLKDKTERLLMRMEGMQGKFGQIADAKTDLSAQLLSSEEEKLRVSKTLVDLQIENNTLQEEMESIKYDLTNKNMALETQLMEAELERDKQTVAARNQRERLEQLEKDQRDLADEYVQLKSNYLAVTEEHEREVARNEELSVELLNLVNAKAALLRQMESMQLAQAPPSTSSSGARRAGRLESPSAEVERVKGIISRLSVRKFRPSEFAGSEQHRQELEKNIFGNQDRFRVEMDRVKNQFAQNQDKLNAKIKQLQSDLTDARAQLREKQTQAAETRAQLTTVRGVATELETQNNRLQHKLKDLTEDFRTRMIQYLNSVAEFTDKGGQGLPDSNKTTTEMRKYVEQMLHDIKKSHRIREDQLSRAAQDYKSRTRHLSRKYELLLIAYRQLREQVEARDIDGINLGKDPTDLELDDSSVESATSTELQRLRQERDAAVSKFESLKLKLEMGELTGRTQKADKSGVARKETMQSMRKQLREFTLNTQKELEAERAELISKNQVLEEQVNELKDYIDSHLHRYKQEIVKLRKMMGADKSQVPSPSPPPPLRTRRARDGRR